MFDGETRSQSDLLHNSMNESFDNDLIFSLCPRKCGRFDSRIMRKTPGRWSKHCSIPFGNSSTTLLRFVIYLFLPCRIHSSELFNVLWFLTVRTCQAGSRNPRDANEKCHLRKLCADSTQEARNTWFQPLFIQGVFCVWGRLGRPENTLILGH